MAQRQQRDLWRTIDADRYVDGSDAATHENRRTVTLTETRQDRKTPPRNRANTGHDDLAAMSMTGEHRRHIQICCFSQPARIVCEQQHRA